MRHVLRRRSVRAEIVRRALAREDVSPASIARASGVSIDRAARELRAVSQLGGTTTPAEAPSVGIASLNLGRAGRHWLARLFSRSVAA